MRLGHRIATISAALLAPLGVWADDADLAPETALAAFEQAALGPASREGAALYRWNGDVTVRFAGRAAPAHHQWANEQLAEFGAITGQTVERIDSIGAEVLVVFVPSFSDVTDGKYNDLLDRFASTPERRTALLDSYRASDAVCAGQVNARGNRLTAGIVFIPVDQLAPVIRACISAQLSRVMGLPFAVDAGAPSVLAAGSPYAHLTRLDRVMLRLLYDPRMKPGMSRKNAGIIARSVLPSVMAQVK